MSYDNPLTTIVYSFDGVSFASSNIVKVLKNPRKGSKGKVKSVTAVVTTTCAGATTTPIVAIGDGTTANKFASVPLLTTAAGTSLVGRDQVSGITALTPGAMVYGATDADLTVTFTAATGAGAAGVADIIIEVDWF